MVKTGICLLFICIIFIEGTFAGECKPTDNITMEKKLYAKLLCNYRKDVRPVIKHETPLTVNVDVMILTLRSDYAKTDVNTITIYTATVLKWKDEFLTWNPKDYDGIQDITMESTSIWTPELSVINLDKQERQYITKPCIVDSSGEVYCTEKFSYSASCSKSYKNWPYDRHNCTSIFGVWRAKEQLDIEFDDSEINIEEPLPNKYWKVLSASITTQDEQINNLKHARVSIGLEIERNSIILENQYLMPIIAMIILSLSSMCLDINSTERMVMILYNVYLHFIYLETLGFTAPTTREEMPNAVIFMRDSLILVCGILLNALLLISISKQTGSTPRWIKSVNEMMRSNVGRIIMFDDIEPAFTPSAEAEDEETTKEELKSRIDKEWEIFARVLNRLSFISIILIYAYFILRFLI